LIFALLAMAMLAAPAFAQTCLQDEYNVVNKQKLNCTANDVRIAKVTNIRDLNGAPLTSCVGGSTFSFIADFEIVTSSSSSRSNIGLYFATQNQADALTGSCVDSIIAPQHPCPGAPSILCGSDNYHELDPVSTPADTCGDTSSSDSSPVFGAGAEGVTVEIDNFLCQAPAGTNQLVLPNCTSWQVPGKTIVCSSPPPSFPYPFDASGNPEAIPGSPSKCNCGTVPLAIIVQTPSISVAKSCTTADSPGTNTSCNLFPEGGTVTYTVDITNTSNFGSIVVDQVCDSAYGDIFTVSGFSGPACPAGTVGTSTGTTCSAQTIASGATGSCTFTANQAEELTVTNTVNVRGHGSVNGTFGPTQSNSVQVVSHEAATTGTITKSFVGNTAGCATVRYGVEVKNTSASGTDETLNLSAFNDSAFGSITTVHGTGNNAVLGTTCAVASGSPGLGSLSGSTGAGALPVTIPVNGGTYTCQFDGQFCSALDQSGCFSHINTVSATLTGDENEVVSLTPGTLNLKECLAGSVQ